MNQTTKNSIFKKAKAHAEEIREEIRKKVFNLQKAANKSEKDLANISSADRQIQMRILEYYRQRSKELSGLYPSPYFARCDVVYEGEKEKEIIYFAKFSFSEKSIYSWVAPVASIRFEKPGNFSYRKPDGKDVKGKLLRKDQFMIAEGNIIFLATEALHSPRELVYQQYFSSRKADFILPEIVERMEKAQDQVIRAHHAGPFVIAGPAGSGKTTLALHRVAYLAQSPDVSHLYKSDTIIVFVQDAGTKKYFSRLLPELGIKDVTITTFAEWALKILKIENYSCVIRYGANEEERDNYEYNKLRALKKPGVPRFSGKIFGLLEKFYRSFLSDDELKLLRKQEKEKSLDRFDIAILLKSYAQAFGRLDIEQEYYKRFKNGNYKKMIGRFPLEYSLIVIDEFQNYLPDQLQLLKSCLKQNEKSILYVGDMAQQINLGTIRKWEDIGEEINSERKVVLQKIYRNTKSILNFIKKLGYEIEIPEEIKEGSPVVEKVVSGKKEEMDYIRNLTARLKEKIIGVLAKDREYLDEFKKEFGNMDNLRIFSMSEAQGVEFDVVCVVGINRSAFLPCRGNLKQPFYEEKKRVQKDLLYVALTRAMSELHVLGTCGLKDSIKECFV
ncbi:MAG: AAA family ATPase [bacterium]|nr:AAA family ATPase [bacterium]